MRPTHTMYAHSPLPGRAFFFVTGRYFYKRTHAHLKHTLNFAILPGTHLTPGVKRVANDSGDISDRPRFGSTISIQVMHEL